MPTTPTATIYTVGHGRHAWADFLALLRQYEIEVLCDVRSAARSRWPQFNGQVLAASLKQAGVGYEWLPECGGKTPAPTAELNRGLERIMELAAAVVMLLAFLLALYFSRAHAAEYEKAEPAAGY